MAKRPSVQDILAAARKGGAAKPEAESEPKAAPEPAVEPESPVESSAAAVPAPPQAPPAPPNVPTPSSLGRPLSLKEKLAAARAGGAVAAPQAAVTEASAAAEAAAPPEAVPAQAAVPPPAAPLGRPMTLQEKLAAVRGSSTAAAAPAAGAAKPAAAKPAATAAAKTGAARELPPLEKITDPRDLAEALRQTGAKKAKESAAKTAEAVPSKPAPAAKAAAPAKPQTVLPKPSKAATTAAAPAAQTSRRGFMIGGVLVSWIAVAWVSFTAGVVALTGMLGRFMFPNVLAEPPSTIKVGTLKDYEPEYVSERYKAASGFWIVRSTRYNGQDIVYALSTICTHLGCPPNWLTNEQKFKCPCHGSGFYITGINFEGPAPRPLERFKVTLADDGQIQVDKSQKFQQELGQWSDPDSYIAAV